MDKDKKIFTANELLNTRFEIPKEVERTYRWVYADGYRDALLDFYKLLDAGVSKGDAYANLLLYWRQLKE